jgi:hypothetical protein
VLEELKELQRKIRGLCPAVGIIIEKLPSEKLKTPKSRALQQKNNRVESKVTF